MSPPQFYVSNVRQGLRRRFKEPVVRAAPCTVAILNKLAAAADPQDPLDFMVLTMCFVAHNGLLRGGELLQLTVGDLRWDTPNRTACSLRIDTSKANQFGPPEWVPYEDFGDNSAAGFLRDYVARFALDKRASQTPLFPAFPQVTCPAALSHAAFTRPSPGQGGPSPGGVHGALLPLGRGDGLIQWGVPTAHNTAAGSVAHRRDMDLRA